MNKKIKKRFTSQLSQLNVVRDFVRSRCMEVFTNHPDAAIDLVVLAVNEAFTNIIFHAYAKEPNHEILLETAVSYESITFDLADKGSEFELDAIPEPNLTVMREHGFGVYIMKTVMDHVSYAKKGEHSEWNHLKLVKKL